MKSSGSMKVMGQVHQRGILDQRMRYRRGTEAHEREQARRKRGRETPGHPLREPFKHTIRRYDLAIMTFGGKSLGSVNRVTLTSKYPSGRAYATLPSGGAPLARRS